MAMKEQARQPERAPTRGQHTQPAADVEPSDSAHQQSAELAAAEPAQLREVRSDEVITPPAGAWVPPTWGEPMTAHAGVVAYSNGGDPGFAPGWSRGQWGYQFQCVEYINRFADKVLGVGNLRGQGHAKDYAGRAFAGLTWVPNDGQSPHPPVEGDILVFTGGAYGHIGVVASSSKTSVEMVHQNWGDNGRKILGTKQAGGGFRVDDLSKYKTAGWQTAGEKARKPEWTRKDLVHLLLGARGEGGNPAESWATALQRGIVTKDEPDAEPLRGELAVMLDRLFMLPCTREEYDPAVVAPFADVRQGEWWADAAARCRLNDLLRGGADNRLRPLDPVTKAEAKSLLSRLREGPSQLTVAQQTAHLQAEAPEPLLKRKFIAGTWVGPGESQAVETLGDQQLYAHGGYMGAAPALLRDPLWTRIMEMVDPGLSEGLGALEALNGLGRERLMKILENHPVLAAFGACREQGIAWNSGQAPEQGTSLEWDVWLHPEQPADLSKALVAHGSLAQTVIAAIGESDTGDDESFTYGRVAKSDPRGVDEWTKDYQRAIALYVHGGKEPKKADSAPLPPIYLDVKSVSSAVDIDLFVHALQEQLGVEVAGVMAFDAAILSEVRSANGLLLFNRASQVLAHFADMRRSALPAQATSEDGPVGIKGVLFNFGSLIKGGKIDEDLVNELALLRHELPSVGLGGYVQENDLGADSHAAIVHLVKAYPGVFNLGFAYGNVDGQVEKGINGFGHGSQRWVPPL
jgi:surface antigen